MGIFAKQQAGEERAKYSKHGVVFNYTVKYSKRRSIEIRIHKGEVLVAAPLNARKTGVEQFLERKSDWITSKLNKQKDNINIEAPKNFEDGNSLYFLGKKYTIELKKDIIADIELHGNKMVVSRPALNPAKIKTQVKNWYKAQAEIIFHERLKHCLELTGKIGVKRCDDISFRRMNSRWGTCTHDNKIILNRNLIYLDVEYIDYVILHELCHFKEKNHSPQYYALLATLSPNYKDIRKRLNRHEIEPLI